MGINVVYAKHLKTSIVNAVADNDIASTNLQFDISPHKYPTIVFKHGRAKIIAIYPPDYLPNYNIREITMPSI